MYGSLKATVFVVAAARAVLTFCCFIPARAVEIFRFVDVALLDTTVFFAARLVLVTVFFAVLEVAALEEPVSVLTTVFLRLMFVVRWIQIDE